MPNAGSFQLAYHDGWPFGNIPLQWPVLLSLYLPLVSQCFDTKARLNVSMYSIMYSAIILFYIYQLDDTLVDRDGSLTIRLLAKLPELVSIVQFHYYVYIRKIENYVRKKRANKIAFELVYRVMLISL